MKETLIQMVTDIVTAQSRHLIPTVLLDLMPSQPMHLHISTQTVMATQIQLLATPQLDWLKIWMMTTMVLQILLKSIVILTHSMLNLYRKQMILEIVLTNNQLRLRIYSNGVGVGASF